MELKHIIMLIGFIAYYLFRARGENQKKQPRQAPPPESSNEEKPSLDDILRRIQEQMEPPKPTPEPVLVEAPAEPVRETVKPKSKPAENTSRRTKKSAIKTVELEEDASDVEVDFDLRQAIINDAILNRPFQ